MSGARRIDELLDEQARARLSAEAVPTRLEPMLATLTHERHDDPDWIYERKLDGQRALLLVADGRATLRSRRGERLDATYPELIEAAEAAQLPDLVVDGEIVALERGAVAGFSRLQQRMGIQDPRRARRTGVAVRCYLFDLLHLGGVSTRDLRLRDRKRLLREVLTFEDPLAFSAHRNGDGAALLEEACVSGWEGLIAKDPDSRYRAGRSRAWLKLKCTARQELVIGGYTPPSGSRHGFGALLVGHYEQDRLRYAGKVGTGYDERTLRELSARLAELEREASPFADRVGDKDARFVEPVLVAEIAFTEWTRDGRLRHPSFLGLRDDKDPRDVVRESRP